MDEITAEEKQVVDELRRRTINDVTPIMLEDISLFYRFAKARDFNLVEAEAMLRKNIEWRKEMEIDTILTDYELPEVLLKYAATSFICFDKEGCVVRIIDCGRIDANGLWNSVRKSELGKFMVYFIEEDKEKLMKKGRNLGKPMYTLIYDFEGLTYANAVSLKSVQYVSYILKLFADNYPETTKRITVINAPFYFSWVFAIMKQALPKTVIDKIRIYGTDGWKDALLELIDADVLPAYLGGTKTDPDGNPLCESFIRRGRPIPQSYYMNGESTKSTLEPDLKKLTVKPFSKKEITFQVKENNSILEWEFKTKSKNIDFLLIYKGMTSKDFEAEELIPKQRIESKKELEKGYFRCKKAGHYAIVFDNTYDCHHSKDVLYRTEVKASKE